MASELREAQRAAGRGRIDEALVHLWNAVEPARLAGDESGLARIARLAREIQREGDPGQQREATRLLEAVYPPARREGAPSGEPARPEPEAEDAGRRVALEDLTRILEETAEVTGPAGEPGVESGEAEEQEPGRRRSRASLLVPLLIALIVIINIVARTLGDR